MKKHYFSENDAISVYQFMDMCGLSVKRKNNILLSHKAMIRKLELRRGMVSIPKKTHLDTMFSEENIKTGKIILVRDDYNQVLVYDRPKPNLTTKVPQTKEEKEERRRELLEEYILDLENQEEKIKPGYQKYLSRKKNMN